MDDPSIFGSIPRKMAEHGNFPSVMEESEEVPSSAFIHDDGDEEVEHGYVCTYISPTPTYDEMPQFACEERHYHMSDMSDSTICDFECISYERMNVTTTSPIYDELPQFPWEESQNPHHLSEMRDSTICEYECNYLEGVSEPPPHRASEVVDRACEAISISNNLTSTCLT